MYLAAASGCVPDVASLPEEEHAETMRANAQQAPNSA